jgi:hypothetical protein
VTAGEFEAGAAEPDSRGCLLLVVCYTDLAYIIGPATDKARDRIIGAPLLGDFIELRFADIGARPGPPTDDRAGLARIVDELTDPHGGAERNYFALMIADRTATTVERLLRACTADPVFAKLPLRQRGLAAVEDRDTASGPAEDITIAPDPDDLGGELQRYADQLLHDFARASEPGLTLSQLGAVRSSLARRDKPHGGWEASGTETDGPEPAPQHVARPRPASRQLAANPAEVLALPPAPTDDAPAPLAYPPMPREPEPASTSELTPEPAALPAEPPAEHPGRRWIPQLRSRRHRPDEPEAGPKPDEETKEPTASGLVYLILSSDGTADDRDIWRRGRSLLLRLDKELAAKPGVTYQVRTLHSAEDARKTKLMEAGELSRHGVKRPIGGLDFARSLSFVATVLERDRGALLRSAAQVTRPAIVFFAADPPLADAVTMHTYDLLSRQASITWVVPEDLADLMSPFFAKSDDAWILIEHPAVIDEIMNLLPGPETAALTEHRPKHDASGRPPLTGDRT